MCFKIRACCYPSVNTISSQDKYRTQYKGLRNFVKPDWTSIGLALHFFPPFKRQHKQMFGFLCTGRLYSPTHATLHSVLLKSHVMMSQEQGFVRYNVIHPFSSYPLNPARTWEKEKHPAQAACPSQSVPGIFSQHECTFFI